MKKTLLVLISIIAALALVGCNAETQGPSTEEPSTPTLTGAEVATRALALMSMGTTSDENTISFSKDKAVEESDLANNENLVVGDVIKAGSKASLTYDANNSQLSANAEITVEIEATEYKISGDVKFGVNKDDLALSVVSADGLTISDAEGTELAISNEDLVNAMTSFEKMISDIVSGSQTPEENPIPGWAVGKFGATTEVYNQQTYLNLVVAEDSFSILVYMGQSEAPDDPTSGCITVSATVDQIENNSAPTEEYWNTVLKNVNVVIGKADIPVTVTKGIADNGKRKLTVNAIVGTLMTLENIEFTEL